MYRSIILGAIALAFAVVIAIPGGRVLAAGTGGWQTVAGAGFSIQVPADWVVTDPSGNGTAIVVASPGSGASLHATAVGRPAAVWAGTATSSFMHAATQADAAVGEANMKVTMQPGLWPAAGADTAVMGSATYTNLHGESMVRYAVEAARGSSAYQLSLDYPVGIAKAGLTAAYYPLRTFTITDASLPAGSPPALDGVTQSAYSQQTASASSLSSADAYSSASRSTPARSSVTTASSAPLPLYVPDFTDLPQIPDSAT